MLANKVKLVIWDLDDTFWDGTLAEGEISPIKANQDIVITLAKRGIISSVCSKNDHATAIAKLTSLGMMEYFVLPKIEFAPKAQNVAMIIEDAALRPDNVLFIDDNVINREEARHLMPELMTADPKDILPVLLDLPEMEGKDDSELTRLKQYKLIESKVVERATSGLGNEEFLRQCDIRIEIDYKIEDEFDRIVELANRTNQLNFTKVRLESPQKIAKFRDMLGRYGMNAAVIRVSDRYGDYGVVGFFVRQRTASRNRLKHFVFSCRTMNMGIEQYVYEALQKPEIKVKGPVANEISPFAAVDWISEGYSRDPALDNLASSKKLTLLGGCELLQLASLCSSNREEFVNTIRNDTTVRFDDPRFITEDREKIAADPVLVKLQAWNHEDACRFDKALSESEIVILAMYASIGTNYHETPNGIQIRLSKGALKTWRKQDETWFNENLTERRFTHREKYEFLIAALDRMSQMTPADCRLFALGVNTRNMEGAEGLAKEGWPACLAEANDLTSWVDTAKKVAPPARMVALRHAFNRFLQDYCNRNPKFVFIDVDTLIKPEDLFEAEPGEKKFPEHFKRSGYIRIADTIREHLPQTAPEPEIAILPAIPALESAA